MKTVAGLWVDHRKAIIVTLSDKGESVHEILSNVEKQPRRSMGNRSTASFESQLMQADDRQQRGFTKHLNAFYDEVLSFIGDAESVLIVGPGEAKGELRKAMEHRNHHDRSVVVESADKMTDRQVAAKVHGYFAGQKSK